MTTGNKLSHRANIFYHFFLLNSRFSPLLCPKCSSPTLCSSSWFLHSDSTSSSLVRANSSSKSLSLCSEDRLESCWLELASISPDDTLPSFACSVCVCESNSSGVIKGSGASLDCCNIGYLKNFNLVICGSGLCDVSPSVITKVAYWANSCSHLLHKLTLWQPGDFPARMHCNLRRYGLPSPSQGHRLNDHYCCGASLVMFIDSTSALCQHLL